MYVILPSLLRALRKLTSSNLAWMDPSDCRLPRIIWVGNLARRFDPISRKLRRQVVSVY